MGEDVIAMMLVFVARDEDLEYGGHGLLRYVCGAAAVNQIRNRSKDPRITQCRDSRAAFLTC
jgi:hypothetical protein